MMNINVLEIRNYLLKPQMREHFIDNFEANFIASQQAVNMHVLGQFRLIGERDHYVWLRGYTDMQTRLEGLQSFYDGDIWKRHREVTNGMLIDSDHVHLLRPLGQFDLTCGLTAEMMAADLAAGTISTATGVIAIDFYQSAPGARDALIDTFETQVLPAYQREGMQLRGLFVAEMSENTFPRHPAIQNEDLLVVFTAYPSESAFSEKRARVAPHVHKTLEALLSGTPETLLLSPTLRSPLRYVGE